MVSRATIADVAREAGVSVATVDQVMNGRLPVRGDTARRVLDSAQRLGFHGTALIRSRLREPLPEMTVGLLLQQPEDPFYRDLAGRLERALMASRLFRAQVRVEHRTSADPADVATALRRLGRSAQAVAFVSPDHPTVAEAVADLTGRGIPVFALLSDCAAAARTSFIGAEGRRVGRVAGWVIHRCARRRRKVGVIVGHRRFLGHEMRELGFRSYFRERAADFAVMDAVVNNESDAATEQAVVQMVEAHPDLVGLFLTGGGIAGAVSGFERLPPESRPVLVSPSLPNGVRPALASGLITAAVCEPLDLIAERLAQLVGMAASGEAAAIPPNAILPVDLVTPESF